tara:strand:- start:428 stop:991 length:564 start_codon:yes stop_codon:yes gene_type:complete
MQEQKMTPGGQPHDPYSHIAIPGQSLTKPKGEYAWEQPPTHTTPDSAIAELLDQLSVPENMARLFTLLENDITVVAIVDAIVLSGFAIGKYNPNVAELIKPDLREFIMMLAEKADIEFKEGVVKERTDFDDALDSLEKGKKERDQRMSPREPADIADEEGVVEEPVGERKGLMQNERPTGIMARGDM